MFRCGGADFIACPLNLRNYRNLSEEREEIDPLLAKTEAIEQGAITIPVRAAQVIEQFTTTADHPEQPAPGMMILDVILEMPRQVVDTRGQQRDLYFRRAGVGFCSLMILQNLSLLARRNRHHLVSKRKAGILPLESQSFQVFLGA